MKEILIYAVFRLYVLVKSLDLLFLIVQAVPQAAYVTRPLVLNHRTQHHNGYLNRQLLSVDIFGQNHTLYLVKNRFLHKHGYIEKTYTTQGRPIYRDTLNAYENHCHYRGHVIGKHGSRVALSACDGFSGVISLMTETFYLEKLDDATHILHKSSLLRRFSTPEHCNSSSFASFVPNSETPQRLRRSALWPYGASTKTRIIELWITNDYRQYEVYDRSEQKLYRPLGIHVALVGSEIWTNGDRIPVSDDADATMKAFLEYRRKHISPIHPNDNSQLITGHSFLNGVVGKALKGVMCSYQHSGGVNMDHSKLVGPVATTVAHEIGHNLGMEHDGEKCTCPEKKCIMAASSGGKNPVHWSSCSKKQLSDSFHQGLDYCMTNTPEKLFRGPVCGNGFVEKGEDCDCGLPQFCKTPCCNASTCKLAENATCGFGDCCDLVSCKVRPVATKCRAAATECDVPEFCNGVSNRCPSDDYLRDGSICDSGKAYCYGGACRSHHAQCQKLWGPTGQTSHPSCYVHFNKLGTDHGHCGYNWVTDVFTKCAEKDVLCGMLHCAHKHEKLNFWKEALAKTMFDGWVASDGVHNDCMGAILDVGLDNADPGMVPDGAKCGDNKLCISQKCQPLSAIQSPACPNCHGNGVCTSRGECFCNIGYAPPQCKHAGSGGSRHGGPASVQNGSNTLMVALLVFFLLVLPILILSVFFASRHREKLKKLWDNRPNTKYQAKPDSAAGCYTIRPPVTSPTTTNAGAPPAYPAPARPSSGPPARPSSAPRRTVSRGSSLRGLPISEPRLDDTSYRGNTHEALQPVLTRSESSRDDKPRPSRPAPRRPDSLRVTPMRAPSDSHRAPVRPAAAPNVKSRGAQHNSAIGESVRYETSETKLRYENVGQAGSDDFKRYQNVPLDDEKIPNHKPNIAPKPEFKSRSTKPTVPTKPHGMSFAFNSDNSSAPC